MSHRHQKLSMFNAEVIIFFPKPVLRMAFPTVVMASRQPGTQTKILGVSTDSLTHLSCTHSLKPRLFSVALKISPVLLLGPSSSLAPTTHVEQSPNPTDWSSVYSPWGCRRTCLKCKTDSLSPPKNPFLTPPCPPDYSANSASMAQPTLRYLALTTCPTAAPALFPLTPFTPALPR